MARRSRTGVEVSGLVHRLLRLPAPAGNRAHARRRRASRPTGGELTGLRLLRPVSAYRLTDRDVQVLAFLAEHRLALAPACRERSSPPRPRRRRGRLSKLANAGLVAPPAPVPRRAAFLPDHAQQASRSPRRPLGAPGDDLREYAHDVGLAWLWLAAHGGTFGSASRDRRRASAALARRGSASRAPRRSRSGSAASVRTAASGSTTPTSCSATADGRRVALELELTQNSADRLETILERLRRRSALRRRRLPGRTRVGRAVVGAARRLGIEPLVHVQRIRSTVSKQVTGAPSAPSAGRGPAPARTRSAPARGPRAPPRRRPAETAVADPCPAPVPGARGLRRARAAAGAGGVAGARRDARGLGDPRSAPRGRPQARAPR